MKSTVALLLATFASAVTAEISTIDPANHYAYAANLGWVEWRTDSANGAVIGDFICKGWIYSANCGWISLGSGTPANGIRYQNNSATDYGVNHDGLGSLRGYAYGANIGWINFENLGDPHIDLLTGDLSGFIYSANCGWISLNNAQAKTRTLTLDPGMDSDGDGIPDAWEFLHFGTIAKLPNDDEDGDGASNLAEHLADTDPTDPANRFVITLYEANASASQCNPRIHWNSVLSRHYRIWKSPDLASGSWLDSGLGIIVPNSVSTGRAFSDTPAQRQFYRVEAIRPLSQ